MQKGSIVSNPETYQIPPRQNAFFHIRILISYKECNMQESKYNTDFLLENSILLTMIYIVGNI